MKTRATTFTALLAVGAFLAFGAGTPMAQEARALRPYAPGTPQFGIGGRPAAPAPAVLPGDEDWSWLADRTDEERNPFDRLRWMPLAADGSVALSLGLDARFGFEHFRDGGFGDAPGSDTTTHLRLAPRAALSLSDRARIFGALKFGDVGGGRFPASPADDDGPDLHQLFGELSVGDAIGLDRRDALVRVGRQELHYGAGRLISIRNGPNLRFDFNGTLARARFGGTVGDFFVMRPSENDPGPWNNGVDETQAVWGLYSSTALGTVLPDAAPLLARSNLDLFYVGHEREVSPYAFQAGPLDETRHTFGARLWSAGPPIHGWNYEVEAGVQVGRADGIATATGTRGADIRAGYVAGDVSYGFADVRWTPVVAMRFGVSTGDDDPEDGTLGTFRAPFPPGRYFGEANPLGPGNLAGVGPSVSVTPVRDLTLTARYQAFWRLEAEDGIYAPPQVPLRPPAGSDRYVGGEIALIAGWRIDDRTGLTATVARFDTADFLDDAGPGEDIAFAQIKLDYSF